MKFTAAIAASTLALGVTALPALAAGPPFVFDGAHLFSAAAVDQANAKIGDFQTQTGKEVVVVTVPSLGGKTAPAAAEEAFAQHQINGVEIFVSKTEKQIGVVPDAAARRFFPAGSTNAIRTAIRSSFNSGDFDGGLNNGVDLVLSQYRSHLGALNGSRHAVPAGGNVRSQSEGGFSMGWIWWIIVLAVIFFVVRGIFRAMAGPRMYGPGPGVGGPGYGGPGYGQPGYGAPMMGGGGGFWSGLLGGLGGAFLGNELFNRGGFGGGFGGGEAGVGGADQYQQQDASGFQSDAGQADMGNASFGGYGDSGGGGWSGGGDAGGGWGGGDGGGGGGDGGGGW